MDDLISRAENLTRIEQLMPKDKKIREDQYKYGISVGLTMAKVAIKDSPSADAVPVVHGRWIPAFDGKFTGGAYWYRCSKCGHTVSGGIYSLKFFCENCGADMRGEQDDNN